MTEADLDRVVARLRVELAALHLGDDRVVSEEDAAELLGVSLRTLRQMRADGKITAGAIGRSPRYGLGMLRRIMREVAEGGRV